MHEWRSAKVRYEDPANIGAGGSRLYHLDGRNKLLARSRGVSAMFRAFLTYPTESVLAMFVGEVSRVLSCVDLPYKLTLP
jgi:hypothetical protein